MQWRWALLAVGSSLLAGLAFAPAALAHDGITAESGDLLQALKVWRFDAPGVVLTLLLAAAYGWGLRRLRRHAPGFHFPRWHAVAFFSGAALLILALVSPIDAYSDDLFWVHMIQHVLIVMLIAPLLLLGAPATLALRAASPRVRRQWVVPFLQSRVLELFLYPPIALTILIGSIWIWHIPAIYDAAIRDEALHFVEHATFLTGSLLFWWLIIGVDASRIRPGHIARVAILVFAILQNIALGLILTSVGSPVYDTYEAFAAVRSWGPDALTDQRIGAGIMWVPGTMMLAVAILAVVYYWADREGFEGRRGDMLRSRRHPCERQPEDPLGGAFRRPVVRPPKSSR